MTSMKHVRAEENTSAHKGIKIFLSILAILLLFVIVVVVCLRQGTMPKEKAAPANTLPESMVQAAMLGEKCTVTMKEMDGFLSYAVKDVPDTSKGIQISKMRIASGGGNHVLLYVPVKKGILQTVVKADTTLTYKNNRLYVKVHTVKAGCLPISPDFALQMASGSFPKQVTRKGDTLAVEIPKLTFSKEKMKISWGLTSLQVENGNFILSTDSVLEALKDYLQGQFQKFLGGAFGALLQSGK